MQAIKTKDFSVSQEAFTLEYDPALHLYKTTPVPENLGKYYESEAYISHTDAKERIIDKLYQLVKKIALKTKSKLLSGLVTKENAQVLDIGCGTGAFLQFLNTKGWNTTGVEPNPSANKKAKAKGVACFFNTTKIPNQKFDVITMWHVLEHVPNFDAQFEEFKKLLNTHGVVVIAVPNFESYDAQFYKEYWAALDVPRHLWHFSEQSISKIAQAHNFKITQTKPLWFDAFYVSLLSEKYKHKKTHYFRAFAVGLLSNLKALQNGKFSSKIYILEPKN